MQEPAASNRRIYGRGLFDGLKMAGIDNPGEFMNAARLEAVERNLSGIAKKVYDVVPVQESWKAHQVVNELARLGSRPDFAVVEGCLSSLKESGLVKETQRGFWQKLPPKEGHPAPSVKLVQDKSLVEKLLPEAQTKEPDALGQLASLGKSLRDLSKSAENIAREIDAIALNVEERIQKSSEETSKLRQLQQLLKSIND